jgi:hypothetical protein
MAMKDYNSSNFRNTVIDRLTGKFGKGDEPTDRKKQGKLVDSQDTKKNLYKTENYIKNNKVEMDIESNKKKDSKRQSYMKKSNN